MIWCNRKSKTILNLKKKRDKVFKSQVGLSSTIQVPHYSKTVNVTNQEIRYIQLSLRENEAINRCGVRWVRSLTLRITLVL